MLVATCSLKGTRPYSPSQPINTERPRTLTAHDFEQKIWKEHCHHNGVNVVIPAISFKRSLQEAAAYRSRKIPGKGQSTYTKHFEAGIDVMDDLVLPETLDNVDHKWFFLNADGKRGGGKRVWRCFPMIPTWEGVVQYMLLDDMITKEVFVDFLRDAGRFIGIGRYRPRNGGTNGRYEIVDMQCSVLH